MQACCGCSAGALTCSRIHFTASIGSSPPPGRGDLWYVNLSLSKNLHQCLHPPRPSGGRDWLNPRQSALNSPRRSSLRSIKPLLCGDTHVCAHLGQRARTNPQRRRACGFPRNKGADREDVGDGELGESEIESQGALGESRHVSHWRLE